MASRKKTPSKPSRKPDERRPEAKGAPRKAFALKDFVKSLGPGLITGASDDDPSGIGTYAVAGASVGFGALWTALVTFPLMAGVQYICARVGLVSGMGLAGRVQAQLPRSR